VSTNGAGVKCMKDVLLEGCVITNPYTPFVTDKPFVQGVIANGRLKCELS
jgi:hypothetical protein